MITKTRDDIIKKYNHWTVKIYGNQEYLGRCVVWCDREDALDLTDATLEEREELFVILEKIKNAIKKVFNNDWINYSFLGNKTKHLHCHVVPRYQSPRKFESMTFIDKRWGRNWILDENFKIPVEILQVIKIEIQKNL